VLLLGLGGFFLMASPAQAAFAAGLRDALRPAPRPPARVAQPGLANPANPMNQFNPMGGFSGNLFNTGGLAGNPYGTQYLLPLIDQMMRLVIVTEMMGFRVPKFERALLNLMDAYLWQNGMWGRHRWHHHHRYYGFGGGMLMAGNRRFSEGFAAGLAWARNNGINGPIAQPGILIGTENARRSTARAWASTGRPGGLLGLVNNQRPARHRGQTMPGANLGRTTAFAKAVAYGGVAKAVAIVMGDGGVAKAVAVAVTNGGKAIAVAIARVTSKPISATAPGKTLGTRKATPTRVVAGRPASTVKPAIPHKPVAAVKPVNGTRSTAVMKPTTVAKPATTGRPAVTKPTGTTVARNVPRPPQQPARMTPNRGNSGFTGGLRLARLSQPRPTMPHRPRR